MRQREALVGQAPLFDLALKRALVKAGDVILFARVQHLQHAAQGAGHILDRIEADVERIAHRQRGVAGGNLSAMIDSGDPAVKPGTPSGDAARPQRRPDIDGKRFAGWRGVAGNVAIIEPVRFTHPFAGKERQRRHAGLRRQRADLPDHLQQREGPAQQHQGESHRDQHAMGQRPVGDDHQAEQPFAAADRQLAVPAATAHQRAGDDAKATVQQKGEREQPGDAAALLVRRDQQSGAEQQQRQRFALRRPAAVEPGSRAPGLYDAFGEEENAQQTERNGERAVVKALQHDARAGGEAERAGRQQTWPAGAQHRPAH